MSIRQLGKINWPALGLYTVQASDMDLGQTYLKSFADEQINAIRTSGLIYGGQITTVSALTIKIAKGAALMPSGQLVTWDDTNITLQTADPSNPRIDRIELALSTANNSNVVNTLNQTVVLDQIYSAALTANKGTAAGSPVANALTSGSVSLGLITVTAGETVLITSNLSQLEDTACQYSALSLGDSNHLIRYNRTKNRLELSVNGSNWTSLAASEFDATVGTGGTYADLNAAMADANLAAGSRLLILNSLALAATQVINKANIEIVCRPGVVLSDSGAGTGIQFSAAECSIEGGKMSGFTTQAILVDVGATDCLVGRVRFAATNAADITDNSDSCATYGVINE